MSRAAVLVTGATGFVGREIVRRLLATDRAVVALARSRDGLAAEDRVAATTGVAPDGRRLAVMVGDFRDMAGSMRAGDLACLRTTVDTVVHCAGDTTFFPAAFGPFRAGHVEGPRTLLERLADGQLRRWVQVSTAYVCGKRTGRVLEAEGDIGQEFHNPYERTKLDAEEALRVAGATRGVEVCVVRPSIIVGPAPETAGGAPASLVFDFIRLVASLARLAVGAGRPLRIAARPRARFNIVPIDYVATAIAALAEDLDGASGTFHLVVAAAPTQDAMLAMIASGLGIGGLRLVDNGDAMLADASPLERRLARRLAPYREYLEQDVSFDDTRARSVLGGRGVPPPTLDAVAVDRMLDWALASDDRGLARRQAALAGVR